jgi:hypothetical protein
MPTVAAGTFSLNCAYFGIPCIGNAEVDTQNICHPDLSVDVSDTYYARKLAESLRDNKTFYNKCSQEAKENYHKHYSLDIWKEIIFNISNLFVATLRNRTELGWLMRPMRYLTSRLRYSFLITRIDQILQCDVSLLLYNITP